MPQSLDKVALDALMELAAASSAGRSPSASAINEIRRLNAEEIASVVREAEGEDWVERYLKPLVMGVDGQRRLRTSAAVMGLALSMGATGMLSIKGKPALAANADTASKVSGSDRAEELAIELQKLAESAALAVEEGDLGNFSPIATVPPAMPESEIQNQQLAAAFPEVRSGTSYHIVQSGETVSGLARSYGVSTAQIVSLNHLASATAVQAGQTLQIPAIAQSTLPSAASVSSPVDLSQLKPYQIKPGDTIDSIARSYDVSRAEIIAVNRLENPGVLKVDQVIALPSRAIDSSHSVAAPKAPSSQAPATRVLASTVNLPEPPATIGVSTPGSDAAKLSVQQPADSSGRQSNPAASYRVQPGDTLAKIARNLGVSVAELSRANRITNPDFIFVGQTLEVPGGIQSPATAKGNQSLPQPDWVATASTSAPSSITQASSLSRGTSQPNTFVASVEPKQYVNGLLGEVRQMRQKFRTPTDLAKDLQTPLIPQPARNSEPKVATQPAPAAVKVGVSPASGYLQGLEAELRQIQNKGGQAIAVTPPLQTPPGQSGLPGFEAQPQQPQVIAAASLGSQSYEPLAQSILGRSVSPALPALTSEPYLPNSVLKGFIWPSEGVLSSGYGWRWGRMHKGIDIAGPVGTPIVAAAGGVVTYADWNDGGYGNLVELTHPDGSITLYAHNSTILVREGQRVRQGEQISTMGSTGNSTGPHLHFEIHTPGQGAVNPVGLLPQDR
ncbi:MAG: LysM peptidoglycan-binding domain-containing protein [Synechococcales cyanobacterium CRU_2_2]|nr:LysM peptidoglycan-binding domain-containing protein [Synechococcales cyanobacterium CRU_2_2]